MNKNFFVAPSYEKAEIIENSYYINESGKAYVKAKIPCKRCGGSGHYSRNAMGDTHCYRCGGRGTETHDIRAYTKKEYNALLAAKERKTQKKIAEKEARDKDRLDNAATYKHELAIKLGFNENETIFIITGANTYDIKDIIKGAGGRFNPLLGWYIATQIELPADYTFTEFSFDELYDYFPLFKNAELKKDVQTIVNNKLSVNISSEFYECEIKDRLRNILTTLVKIATFDGQYGISHIYTFKDNENHFFVWKTTSVISFSIGDTVDLTGTVKEFSTYNGIKQTILSRCTLK